MDENKPHRRWLSFGIRDLLWSMVVLGVVLGWVMSRSTPKLRSLETGRYQMLTDADGILIMYDTATGQHWARDSYSRQWHNRLSPQQNPSN